MNICALNNRVKIPKTICNTKSEPIILIIFKALKFKIDDSSMIKTSFPKFKEIMNSLNARIRNVSK